MAQAQNMTEFRKEETRALVLNQEAVMRLLTMPACIEAMHTALTSLSSGRAHMPVRSVVPLQLEDPSKTGLIVSMPSYLAPDLPDEQCFIASKSFTVFPANGAVGKPAHQGVTLLFEANHGSLLAIADAHEVTAIRTAAASAVATRELAKKGPCVLALLGSGVQAKAHYEAIKCVREVSRINIWSRKRENAERLGTTFADEFADASVVVTLCDSPAEAAADADIICTLTGCLMKDEPILTADMVRPGTHINAVGACQPFMRELDPSVVLQSRVFVDTRAACETEPGDLVQIENPAEHIIAEMGEVLMGKCEGRQNDEQITLFKSVGAAIEDLCAAAVLYMKAKDEPEATFPTM